MLRVGQSLFQSTKTPFQASCKILRWSLVSRFPTFDQVRLESHAVPQLQPIKEPNTTQNDPDKAEPSVASQKTSYWKWDVLEELRRHKPISALRLPQEQRKSNSMETANHGIPGIIIHPAHRSRRTDPASALNSEGRRPYNSFLRTCVKGPQDPQNRKALLWIISQTQSASKAWDAYNTLLSLHKSRNDMSDDAERSISQAGSKELTIPYPYLHRVARLLASTHPRTRQLFLRLLSVLTTLRRTGGPIFLWEWNALIDCAGKGWRKSKIEDYQASVAIFQDMVTSSQATSSSSEPRHALSVWRDTLPADSVSVEEADIFTFTTLLDIASRTLNNQAIHHALSLLSASELPWNNVTHMARLPYFIHTNQLHAVRGILLSSVTRGLDIVTLNGCLWAYAYRGRLRMVMQVYDLLRRNIPLQDRLHIDDSNPPHSSFEPGNYMGDQDKNHILSIPGFTTQATMAPDAVTYTLIIQALCYHGDLISAITVFRDMVSTVDPALRPPGPHNGDMQTAYYKPTYAIYRAIFLGFARHANKKPLTLASSLIAKHRGIDSVPLKKFAARVTASYPKPAAPYPSTEELTVETPWTLENLEKIFDRFLEMDWGHDGRNAADITAPPRPSDRMIYWIMVAYAKTTKGNVRMMHDVWKQLDARFGYECAGVSFGGRLSRIAKDFEARQTDGGDVL